jgi:MFS family permease
MTIPAHVRIYSVFFLFALALGGLLSRMADLQHQLGVTESQLGLTLIGMAIGSLISLTIASPLILRFGARWTAFATVFGTATLYALVPWLPNAEAVFVALFFAGLLAGALEINVNIETDKLEAILGRRIMNRAHGMWSLGFFVTALIGAGMRHFGVSIQAHTAIMLAVVLAAGFLSISGMTTAAERPDAHEGEHPKFAVPTWGLLPLCMIGIAAFLVEGAGIDWSTIYMRDVFDAEPFVGGLGLTLFTLFMAVTRLFIDPVVDTYGPRRVAGTLLGIAAVGVLMVGLAPADWVALVGFALLGLGCSAVYPLAVSAAAQRTDRPAAVNVAAIGQVTFVVFFLAPPMLGFVAEYLGIRNSYLICLPVLALGLLAIPALEGKARGKGVPSVPEPLTPNG